MRAEPEDKQKNKNKQIHKYWTEEEFKELEKLYKKGYSLKQIGEELGRTNHSVYAKLKRHGMTKDLKGRVWTKEEDAYLSNSWGVLKLKSICTHLHRTEKSVLCRVCHLKLGGYFNICYTSVTLPDLIEGMGITRMMLDTWRKHGLKVHAINVGGKQVTKASRKLVYWDDLLEWLEAHQDMWDSTKVSSYFFIEQPDWMKEKFKRDKQRKTPRPGDRWTQSDLNKLTLLYMKGYTIKRMSEELGRTEASIKSILYKKDIELNRAAKPWTVKEELTLIELSPTKTVSEIAEKLNRPYSGVLAKQKRLKAEGRIEKVNKQAYNRKGQEKDELK